MPDTFIERHSDEISQIARKLEAVIPRASLTAGDGFANLRAKWNESITEPGFAKSQRHEILANAYRWLKAGADSQENYHKALYAFVERGLDVEDATAQDAALRKKVATRAWQSLVEGLELGFAGITTALERQLPDDDRRTGHATVRVRWTGNDAMLSWRLEGAPELPLRSTAFRLFSSYGQFPADEAGWLADNLVRRLRDAKDPLFPHFSYPDPRRRNPEALLWVQKELKPRDELPDWIRGNTRIAEPSELETDLKHKNAALAERLDEILCEAAVVDHERREHADQEDDGAHSHAVEEFVEEISRQSGHHPAELVELFGRVLVGQQERNAGRERTAARTEALASLWSLLNEP